MFFDTGARLLTKLLTFADTQAASILVAAFFVRSWKSFFKKVRIVEPL